MANRAYLLAVNDPSTTWTDNAEEEIIAEGINEIPVFWASLFVDGDGRLDTYEGEDGGVEIPNWCADSNLAKERLARLVTPISELLDERSREIWEMWVRHLTAETALNFKTNAAEVWALDPDGYDAYMKTMLQAFAEPSAATMTAAIEANDLSCVDGEVSWDDEEATICKLAGADHIRDVPWLACITGCTASAPTDTNSTPTDNAQATLSEEVLSWIGRGSKVGAVKLHQRKTGLSLVEAKKQVEDVMKRDGLVLGGQ